MKTLRLRADPRTPECPDLILAAKILREGGTVAFATETVYGLGANALDAAAVAKIFEAKQRPGWDPLIVHLADRSEVSRVAEKLPAAAQAWAERFWPGPLTLLVPRAATLPAAVTAGRARVGIRMPAHPVAIALLRAADLPVAAPSANTFGHVSPTTADHVAADLDGRIDAILDSGPTRYGLESTVVDACEDPCIVYRPGAITLQDLRAVWDRVEPFAELGLAPGATREALPSPGLGMRHYAPRARLVLVVGAPTSEGSLQQRLLQVVREEMAKGQSVGVMLPCKFLQAREREEIAQDVASYPWGEWAEPATLARELYAALRGLDGQGVDCIVCPMPSQDGLGAAIRDRLRKAARRQ